MIRTFVDSEEIARAIPSMKRGDIVLQLKPKHNLARRLAETGLHGVFGCTSYTSVEPEPSITIWSTLFAGIASLEPEEARRFPAQEIDTLIIEDAESYIRRESSGQFAYGMPVQAITSSGVARGVVVSYFNGLVDALVEGQDDVYVFGGAHYFTSIAQ